MFRLFLVEDDRALREQLREALGNQGFEVIAPEDFGDVAEHFRRTHAQIVVLDIKLPRFDGFYWCKEIRKDSAVPILMLSSRDTSMDMVMGLSTGADDYLTKPVDIDVLVAKLRALLRRAYDYHEFAFDITQRGKLVLDSSRYLASCEGREVDLTKNEMTVLRLLMRAGGTVVSRDALMTALWSDEVFVDENTLNVNVARLRTKLKEIGIEEAVQTLKGEGYRFV